METKIISAVEAIDEKRAIALVKTEIELGKDKKEIANQLNFALQRVAIHYEEGEYYIADLIMAGELVSNLLKMMGMDSTQLVDGRVLGKIVVGTVFDDIHDVGKNIFISMLRSEGFEVIDMGTDVAAQRFIEIIRKEKPDIVGISGILTSVVENIKEVIDEIKAQGLRDDVKIILGGALAGTDYAKYVGADGYSSDAIEGVSICKQWLRQ
ncbi:cobalamin B12-binding domain-containing protein [Acetobacterium woodii]|uniref:Corrinoid protein MttC7 n=1 Tax=Acetobacterium woodii (strain ATCC 29683 / DSM 1030 / JCM 2381 / KCTC 1655 / WB1) TaxID=931626 RepID=H6LB49_ACEWD|nr:cobalamin-dependent protein [Acetobacterium woodii]AFA47601.1 corrinoid protein MttC7 [Acetobacterium woodii DSM 1030]